MVAITSENGTGLCSLLPEKISGDTAPRHNEHGSVHTILQNLKRQNTISASWGLAALNSLLNPNAPGKDIKAQEVIKDIGRNKNIAIIGHFPFVEKIDSCFNNLWVLEKSPRPMDFHEYRKADLLPLADVIAITATTLLNGSLGEILNLARKDCVKILLGPSTPLSSCLLDMGIDILGGAIVQDDMNVYRGIQQNLPFRKLQGVGYNLMSHKFSF